MTRYYEQRIRNMPIQRRLPAQVLLRALFIILASGVIAAGFIYAIHQRAEAVEYGYRTQKLVHLREQLEREKRQLKLERAHYRSPQVIEESARKLGLVRPDLSQVIIAEANGEFRRWTPKSKKRAAGPGSRGSKARAAAVSPPASRGPGSESTAEGRLPAGAAGTVARTRAKRIESTEASGVVPGLAAHGEMKERGDTAPHAWLVGVLEFPEGKAELKLDEAKKRKQRKKRQH